MKRILGIGNSLTDILIRMPDDSLLPRLGYSKGSMNLISETKMQEIESLIRNESLEIRSGGSAANTIHALSTLGIPCAYIGKTGQDDTGRQFTEQLTQAGVNMLEIPAGRAPSGRCYVLISPDCERTFATYLGSALELSAQDLRPEHFTGYDIVHIEGYLLQNLELIEKAMSLARQQPMTVSLDLASYNVVLANLSVIRDLCRQHVGILFANEEEGKAFAGDQDDEDILEKMSGSGSVAILKLGARGAKVKYDGKIESLPAIPSLVQDTTGAGDIFAAGFLAGYAHGKDMMQSLCWGTQLAAEIIRIIGARLPQATIGKYKQAWGI